MRPLRQHPLPQDEGRSHQRMVRGVRTERFHQVGEILRVHLRRLGIGAGLAQALGQVLGVRDQGIRLTAAAAARIASITP